MSVMRHLRCDRCDVDITVDSRRLESGPERRWAHCRVGLETYDFCPNCWLEMKPKDLTKQIEE